MAPEEMAAEAGAGAVGDGGRRCVRARGISEPGRAARAAVAAEVRGGLGARAVADAARDAELEIFEGAESGFEKRLESDTPREVEVVVSVLFDAASIGRTVPETELIIDDSAADFARELESDVAIASDRDRRTALEEEQRRGAL